MNQKRHLLRQRACRELTYLFAFVAATQTISRKAGAAPKSELGFESLLLFYDGPNGQSSPMVYGVGIAYHSEFDSLPLRLGAGARTGFGGKDISIPAEAFVQAQIVAKLGTFEPACGSEFGVSGFARLPLRESFPKGSRLLSQERTSPFYGAMAIAPLRWHWGRWSASFLEAQLGITLDPPGSTSRLALGIVNIGGEL